MAEAAPETEVPAVAPQAVEASIEVAASATPVAEAEAQAPVAEQAAAEVATTEPAAEPTAEPAKAEPSIIEAAKGEEPKAEVVAEPEKPAEPVVPTYVDFKLPEGFEAAPEQIQSFTSLLGKNGLSQEAGQELMDLHGSILKQAVDHITQAQQDTFQKMRSNWRAQFNKSAGNRADTIANDAKWLAMEMIKDPKERQSYWDALAYTGMGDNPIMLHMFGALAKRISERSAPLDPVPSNGHEGERPADRRYGRRAART